MQSTLSRILLTLGMSAFLLSACDRQKDTEQPTTPPTTPKESEQTITNLADAGLTNSPTIEINTLGYKTVVFGNILEENKSLTDEQKKCLISNEANATYEPGNIELVNLTGTDLLKESDKFYETEIGQKFRRFIEQQLFLMADQKIEGEIIVITDEDQLKATEYRQNNPTAKEMETKMSTLDPQKTLAQFQEYTIKEKARCHIN